MAVLTAVFEPIAFAVHLKDVDDLDEDFTQTSESLTGPLSISIAREFGLSFLKPTLFAFMNAHPQIDLTVDFDDRTVDLENENYDLGVRISAGNLAGLECYPIGATRHGLFASPLYAENNGLLSRMPTSSITDSSIMDRPAVPDGSFCTLARSSLLIFNLR